MPVGVKRAGNDSRFDRGRLRIGVRERNKKIFVFTRNERLKGTRSFRELFATGRRFSRNGLLIIYLPAPQTKAAIIASKRIGSAVKRNRIKRILREAYRMLKDKIIGRSVILYAQRDLTFDEAVAILKQFATI